LRLVKSETKASDGRRGARGEETKFERMTQMLFEPMFFVVAGGVIAVSVVERIADDLGFTWIGTILKLAIPIAGIIAGVYFIESNPIIRWLR
jgi:hypothetical protein